MKKNYMYHSEKYCKNCSQHLLLDQKFCHNCGQKTDTHRINFHFLVHEIQHGIFHVDKGIFYTIKELFTRPGHSIREYIEGKRQNHFKPALLIMILGAILVLLNKAIFHEQNIILAPGSNFKFDKERAINQQHSTELTVLQSMLDLVKATIGWINNHFAITILLMVPLYALALYLAFYSRTKKRRYNLAEYLVIATFFSAQHLVVMIVMLPFKNNVPLLSLSMVLMYGLNFWALLQLFKNRSVFHTTFRSFLAIMFYTFFFTLVIAAGITLKIINLINEGVIKT